MGNPVKCLRYSECYSSIKSRNIKSTHSSINNNFQEIQSQTRRTKIANFLKKFKTPIICLFLLLFASTMVNFGPLSWGQPHWLNVTHCIFYFRPKSHWEPHNKVGSLRPAEHLVGFEPRTFWFWLQGINPLSHSPQVSQRS